MKNGLQSQETSLTNISIETIKEFPWRYEAGLPKLRLGKGPRISIDPFPCYTHDEEVIKKTLSKVKTNFSFDIPISIYNLGYEIEERTNAFAESCFGFRIVLSGKRTPIHPHITKYVVAHEYGHIVQYWLDETNGSTTIEKYQKIRGLEDIVCGGRTWHKSVAEVFADDFRVLVAKVDKQYWPHPGIERPEDNYRVVEFWKD